MREEDEPAYERSPGQPETTAQLPPELADFLNSQDFAGLLQATDRGTVYVLKAPAEEIARIQGRIPIGIRYELYDHPAAPVIRTVLTLQDQPDSHLAVETFTNVEDPAQYAEFAGLAEQEDLLMLCYDEALNHRLTKHVPLGGAEPVREIAERALALLVRIPRERFNFERAKQDVITATRL